MFLEGTCSLLLASPLTGIGESQRGQRACVPYEMTERFRVAICAHSVAGYQPCERDAAGRLLPRVWGGWREVDWRRPRVTSQCWEGFETSEVGKLGDADDAVRRRRIVANHIGRCADARHVDRFPQIPRYPDTSVERGAVLGERRAGDDLDGAVLPSKFARGRLNMTPRPAVRHTVLRDDVGKAEALCLRGLVGKVPARCHRGRSPIERSPAVWPGPKAAAGLPRRSRCRAAACGPPPPLWPSAARPTTAPCGCWASRAPHRRDSREAVYPAPPRERPAGPLIARAGRARRL
ncbi:hypothetical protein CUTA107171_24475 [Cupriavidus taiwanensis]